MGKQEGSPSGRCCAPWRQTSALHKAGGRASAPPGPSDLHLPEELLRHNDTNPHDCLEILNILFYLSLLQVPCPELGLVCSRAFHCFCCFVKGLVCVFYVPPFKPAISYHRACNVHCRPWGIVNRNTCISGATALKSTASSLFPFHVLCKTLIPSSRAKLWLSQRLLRITLSPGQQDAESVNIRLCSVDLLEKKMLSSIAKPAFFRGNRPLSFRTVLNVCAIVFVKHSMSSLFVGMYKSSTRVSTDVLQETCSEVTTP